MIRYFICLSFIIAYINLNAQVYNVAPYSLDEGLHQSQVLDIMQDRRGYLWLGTHRGVSKFDGNNFKVYEARNSEIRGNFVNIILEDRNGDIWVGTEKGLSRYHPNTFKRYKNPDDISGEAIRAMLQTEDGKLWIGGQAGNLYHWHEGKYSTNSLPWEDKPEEISIRDIEPGAEGRVWIGTTKGLFYFEPKEAEKGIQAFGASDKMSDLLVFDIQHIEDDTYWIGTQQGIFSLDPVANSYEPIRNKKINDPNIYCLAKDMSNNEIWIGTGKGVFVYHGGEFFEVSGGDRMLDVQVRTFLIDREGSTWIGTDGSGMRKITEASFVKYDVEDGFSSKIAKSFLEDKNGKIWVSSRDRGIDVFQTDTVIKTYSTRDKLGGDAICSSFEDSEGNFWFASYNGTLSLFKEGRFTSFDKEDGLECSSVFCMTEDAEGDLWVGTDQGVFKKKGNRFERIYHKADGLISDVIYSLLPDSKGNLWIGTEDGLAICNGKEIQNIPQSDAIGNNVITLIEDPKGRIWTGSSAGLGLFQDGAGKYIKNSGASGAQIIVSLLIQDDRFLWIGTERGVFKLDLEKFDPNSNEKPPFEYFSKKDGLPSLECNANAIFEDSQGNIWFGTAEGPSFISSGIQRLEESFQPPVYITAVNSSISQDSSWESLGYALDDRGLPIDLKLAPTDNRVDIDFIGLSMNSPKQVEYKIMMEGVDQDWVRPKSQSLTYPNLDPGKYTFKVTAKMETEPWREDIFAAFSFEILPPFWQRWWFILPMSLLFLGFIYLIYLGITYRRRQLQEETRIRNTAEKLQLEHQALYAMMNPHFTFNALQSIQYFIHRQDKKAANKFLSSFAKLVRKNLESTKSDFISLNEELDRLKLYLSLEKMRFPEKFDYSVKSDPDIVLSDIQIPPMILQPFVENSIKHGIMPLDADGMIEVDLHKQDEDYLSITIKDNGIGIEASKKAHANRPNDHVSKGMQITLDRLALFARMTDKNYALDIKEIKNEKGEVKGTLVEMILPIKQDVYAMM